VPESCEIIDLDSPSAHGQHHPLPTIAGDALAYVYFTSGSTDRPKGVTQTHRNLLFFCDAYAKALAISAGDRVSLVNALSFAAGNMQVFRALLHGATVCAYDMRRNGIAELAAWLDRERVTILHAAPAVFREMVNRLAPERLLPHLRAVHLGGDVVFASDVELFRRSTVEHCVLVNQLASTEAGVIAQNVIGHRTRLGPTAVVPVGRSIEGVRVQIRRDDESLAETDEVGEMVVSGSHVSPGYWRRPDLDAVAFCVDPRAPSLRHYRSGDLGRIDADGNLHFLGRKGSRVKVRGHSVDLMEIEAALSSCPGVRQAAVIAKGDGSKENPTRLVAYVATHEAVDRDPVAARRHLATRLPLYMLPAEMVYLDALPTAASGKTDRKLLAGIDATTDTPKRPVGAPQDEVERTIAEVFGQLLSLDPAGRDDDFFLFGGDSLLAVELQARLKSAFGVHVGNLHEQATVAGIAKAVRRALADPASRSRSIPVLVPLWTSGSEPPLFLVHGRHGQAFVSPHFMQLLGDSQPAWAFQARGLDGLREPHATVEDMASEYLAELRLQRPHGPYFLGALCAGVYIATIMARTLRQSGETVLPLLLLDPPNNVFHEGYSQLTQEQFVAKMTARRARGLTAGPVEDPAYLSALVRTAMAFEHAIAHHRPLQYDGPVYVLTSRQRSQGADQQGLRQLCTGRVKRYEVGSTHTEALDPRNPVFASTLQRCVSLIRAAAVPRVASLKWVPNAPDRCGETPPATPNMGEQPRRDMGGSASPGPPSISNKE
jgi:acyl-coenzyme A synthetase/AMP-(fatty) acid ligase/acyl carrier protein